MLGDDDRSSPIITTVSIILVVLVSILGFICGAISIAVCWNSSKNGSSNNHCIVNYTSVILFRKQRYSITS